MLTRVIDTGRKLLSVWAGRLLLVMDDRFHYLVHSHWPQTKQLLSTTVVFSLVSSLTYWSPFSFVAKIIYLSLSLCKVQMKGLQLMAAARPQSVESSIEAFYP